MPSKRKFYVQNFLYINSLDGANYDLAEWIDERLENFTGVQAAEYPTPEEKTVDKLPVIH